MNVGLRLIQLAVVYLVTGLGIGLAMGISHNLALVSLHSHVLLLGWATMAAAGIIYTLLPGCNRSPLARLHFWGLNVGLPVMVAGLALEAYGVTAAEKVLAASSTLVLVSLAFFAANVLKNGSRRPGASA